MVVDADMYVFPAGAISPAALRTLAGAIACDAVSYAVEFTQTLDVEVDQAAGRAILIAPFRHGRFKIAHPAQSRPAQDPADGGGRYASLGRDVIPGEALSAQSDDPRAGLGGCGIAQFCWSRGAVPQAFKPLRLEAAIPLRRRSSADAADCGCLGKAHPAFDHPNQPFSTNGRQSGILVHVHSIPPNNVEAW